MSNYKLTFKLKQHTPIIHFQHDQHGATLRATEVKPKLDRFLIEKLQLTQKVNGKEVPKPAYKKWFINEGKEHPALDYKLRFEPVKDKSYYLFFSFLNNARKENLAKHIKEKKLINKTDEIDVEIIAPSPYFANNDKVKFQGDNIDSQRSKFDELRYGIMSNDNIKGMITTMNQNKCQVPLNNQTPKDFTLLELVREVLPEFFLVHNFGTRQNKGFGSFTVEEIDNNPLNITKKEMDDIFKKNYAATYQFNNDISLLQDLYRKIVEDYTLLKSGINRRNNYKKSLLFLYFVSQTNPIRWEKRKIKQQIHKQPFQYNHNDKFYDILLKVKSGNSAIYDKNGNQSWDDPSDFNYKFVRAVLGLAESYEFQTMVNGYSYFVEVSNDDIERYQSPIIFKLINNKLYLLAKNTFSSIKNKQFEFKLRLKRNNKIIEQSWAKKDLENLFTPDLFDITNFLEFAFVTCKEKINGWKKNQLTKFIVNIKNSTPLEKNACKTKKFK